MACEIFTLRSHILIESDQGSNDVILIDGHTGTVCASNATAGTLIMNLRVGATLQALVDALVAQFEVTTERAHKDVERFLDHLSAMGMIEQKTSPRSQTAAA